MAETRKDSASAPDSAVTDPAELLKALAAQKDDYLRLAADFDNFRKRIRRDSEQQAAAEKESFIRELLPILDNLERALACEHSTSSAQLHQGVQMTLQQLGRLLKEHGIEATDDRGIPFDPHQHEALSLGQWRRSGAPVFAHHISEAPRLPIGREEACGALVVRVLLSDAEWARKIHEGRSSELIGFSKEALATLA